MENNDRTHFAGDEGRDLKPSAEILQTLMKASYLWGPNRRTCEEFLDEFARRMDTYKSRWTTIAQDNETYRYKQDSLENTIRFLKRADYFMVSLSEHKMDRKNDTTYKKKLEISLIDRKPELILEKGVVCVSLNPPEFPSDSCMKILITDSPYAKVEERGAITILDLVRSKPKRVYYLPVQETIQKINIFF